MRDENAFRPPSSVLSVDMPHMHLQISGALLAQDYHLEMSIPTNVGDFEIWQRL